MQVDFYQLSRDPVDKILPVIAERVLAAGGRLLVVAADQARLDHLSGALWDAASETFLANDLAGQSNDALQPILLSNRCEAVNGARHVAIADGQWRDEALRFERAFFFFDDATIEGARMSWRTLAKAEGVSPRFWRQEGRKWVQGP